MAKGPIVGFAGRPVTNYGTTLPVAMETPKTFTQWDLTTTTLTGTLSQTGGSITITKSASYPYIYFDGKFSVADTGATDINVSASVSWTLSSGEYVNVGIATYVELINVENDSMSVTAADPTPTATLSVPYYRFKIQLVVSLVGVVPPDGGSVTVSIAMS